MISLSASADYGFSGQYIARITGRDSKFTFKREFIGRKTGKRNDCTQVDVDTPGLYEICDVTKRGKNSNFVLLIQVNDQLIKFVSDKEDAMIIAKALEETRSFEDIVQAHIADPEAAKARKQFLDLKRLYQIAENFSDHELNLEVTLQFSVGDLPKDSKIKNSDLRPLLKSELEKYSLKLMEFTNQGKHLTTSYTILSAKEAKQQQSAQTINEALQTCWLTIQALPIKDAMEVIKLLKEKVKPKNTHPNEENLL